MNEEKRESLTIEKYLSGCNCETIYFSAGGCILKLTNLEDESSKLIQPGGYEMLLGNDLTINRFYEQPNDQLIEVQIKADYATLFYMSNPTGTFVYKDTI